MNNLAKFNGYEIMDLFNKYLFFSKIAEKRYPLKNAEKDTLSYTKNAEKDTLSYTKKAEKDTLLGHASRHRLYASVPPGIWLVSPCKPLYLIDLGFLTGLPMLAPLPN